MLVSVPRLCWSFHLCVTHSANSPMQHDDLGLRLARRVVHLETSYNVRMERVRWECANYTKEARGAHLKRRMFLAGSKQLLLLPPSLLSEISYRSIPAAWSHNKSSSNKGNPSTQETSDQPIPHSKPTVSSPRLHPGSTRTPRLTARPQSTLQSPLRTQGQARGTGLTQRPG